MASYDVDYDVVAVASNGMDSVALGGSNNLVELFSNGVIEEGSEGFEKKIAMKFGSMVQKLTWRGKMASRSL